MGESCRCLPLSFKKTRRKLSTYYTLNMILLTHENLHAIAPTGIGFNARQLKHLGVTTHPKKGWTKRLIGREIPDDLYAELLALKGSKSKSAKNSPEPFAGYQLPPAQEKRQETHPESVAMSIPLDCVDAVLAIIRLRESMAVF